MSAAEHLDPIPDSFILQPPVFHPVSSLNSVEESAEFQLAWD